MSVCKIVSVLSDSKCVGMYESVFTEVARGQTARQRLQTASACEIACTVFIWNAGGQM